MADHLAWFPYQDNERDSKCDMLKETYKSMQHIKTNKWRHLLYVNQSIISLKWPFSPSNKSTLNHHWMTQPSFHWRSPGDCHPIYYPLLDVRYSASAGVQRYDPGMLWRWDGVWGGGDSHHLWDQPPFSIGTSIKIPSKLSKPKNNAIGGKNKLFHSRLAGLSDMFMNARYAFSTVPFFEIINPFSFKLLLSDNHKSQEYQNEGITQKLSWRSRKVCRLNFSKKVVGNAIWFIRSLLTKLNTFKKISSFRHPFWGEVHIIIATPQAMYIYIYMQSSAKIVS